MNKFRSLFLEYSTVRVYIMNEFGVLIHSLFKEGTMSNVHLRFVRACWRIGGAAALVAVMLLVLPTSSASAATTENGGLSVQTVCFTVYNTGDPQPSTLYGLRYTYGHPKDSTPTILRVHEIRSPPAYSAFTASWSFGRPTAPPGLVVLS